MDRTKRRLLLAGGTSGVTLALASLTGIGSRRANAKDAQTYEVTHTEAEWKKLLSPVQYNVLRQEGTERAFTSPLNDEHREGTFACAGCALDAFSSKTKFDSGTGWPSFYQPLPNAVAENRDTTFGMIRVEIHCRRCGGHLGHVFDDGPQPTGKRYCMNGVALTFKPGAA